MNTVKTILNGFLMGIGGTIGYFLVKFVMHLFHIRIY
jgi:hypothetical protein